mmetsp:Transcript_3426/g.10560  ORF Transcript_3426/g.10560 Transcript_3426/m.10560 type:complete len:83 (+) Transcript_3426:161-409(+)
MLLFSYGVTNAVPFFEPLLGLIGGLLSGPINFLLPVALYLGALCRDLGATARGSPCLPMRAALCAWSPRMRHSRGQLPQLAV